jgi:hypothetical protein
LVEESGVPGENHQPATSHWQTLSWLGKGIKMWWSYEWDPNPLLLIIGSPMAIHI